ncbi:MAG: DUF4387 family protein, partial [Proteobacteria bacterium]|nr:DUF4387 family protein [Pseudomonadota bacterium]
MKLSEIAFFIKSNNAGATFLTFDIGFKDAQAFDRVMASGTIGESMIETLYPFARGHVRIYAYRPALVIKVTVPRPATSGGPAERNF